MITLKIDGKYLDISQDTNVAVTLGICNIEAPEDSAAGYSQTFDLPFTPRNRTALRFSEQIFSKEQFNNELHSAECLVDGITVMLGIATIDKYVYKKCGGGSFNLTIIGAAYKWVKNAKKRMNELVSADTVAYRMANIYANSIDINLPLIKFFPIDRGAFYKKDVNDKYTPRKTLHIFDYHPFINVLKALTLIFRGFNIHTSIASDLQQIYASGYFPETKDLEYVKERNDFKAGTLLTSKDLLTENTVVDIFNCSYNGEGDFFPNDVISKTDMSLCTSFRPKDSLALMFEIELQFFAKLVGTGPAVHYVDTFIFGALTADPSTLTADQYYFPIEDSVEYENATKDPRSITTAGTYYITLDMRDGSNYKYVKFKSDTSFVIMGYLGERNFVVQLEASPSIGLQIYVGNEKGPQSEWVNVESYNTTTICIVPIPERVLTFARTIRTTPHSIAYGEAWSLGCVFRCSQAPTSKSKQFSVSETCTIKPVIGNYIGEGDEVGISTVGGNGTQIDFISALRQMYNLLIYTNPITNDIYIEPRTHFYKSNDKFVDWSGKIDFSKDIQVEELGADMGNSLMLAYSDSSDVAKRYARDRRSELSVGAYKVPLRNKTSDEPTEITNPIYSPFVLRHISSVGVDVPQNAVETTQDEITDAELSITPMIGYFGGLGIRSAGDDKQLYPKYPLLYFQSAALGINLGFDDISIDDKIVVGLHKYYDVNIYHYDYGRRITLYCNLSPQDVEAMLMPNNSKRDLRAVFLLRIDSEIVPCNIEQIEDYDPSGGESTKCAFILTAPITTPSLTVVTYGDIVVTRNDTAIGYADKRI